MFSQYPFCTKSEPLFVLKPKYIHTPYCKNTHVHPPSPLFILEVSAAVIEKDVGVFSKCSLHHTNTAVKKDHKLFRVQDLLLLLLCQLPRVA